MSVVELGGARVAEGGAGAVCSLAQVRRLLAGELSGDALVQAEAHVAGCARCAEARAEVEREQAALAAAVPFDAFAAGVAEKLARAGSAPRAGLQARPRWRRWTERAAAAAVLLVAAAGLSTLRSGGEVELAPGVRVKGGAGVSVFALRAARTFALRDGEATQAGDRLLPALEPGGHAQVVVALAEPGEVSLLYRGPARAGPLPEAFEWTGAAREARVIAVYADEPLDGEAVLAAIREGRVASGKGVEVVERKLAR